MPGNKKRQENGFLPSAVIHAPFTGGFKNLSAFFNAPIARDALPVVFLPELLDAPAGFKEQFLAPRIERMALRTDLDVYVLLGRTRYKFVPAAAPDLRLKIFRLYGLPHL